MIGQVVILGSQRAFEQLVRIACAAVAGTVVEFKPARRSIPQNKRMQAMLSDVARAKPRGRVLTTDQWKCLFMDEVAKETGNPSFQANWQPSLDETHAVNLGYRSSRLLKAEMGDLMDFIEAWGNQNGVQWSNDQEGA